MSMYERIEDGREEPAPSRAQLEAQLDEALDEIERLRDERDTLRAQCDQLEDQRNDVLIELARAVCLLHSALDKADDHDAQT